MSESGYPDNYDFEADGKATLEGKYVSINAVTAKKFGSDEMVEKFVLNIEDATGTTWAVWLDSAVLNRAFRDEAKNRAAIGKRFEEGEKITIEFLGKRQGATYQYKDFRVEFEFAAPSVDGFDALVGSTAAPSEADALSDNAEPTIEPQPEPVAAASGQLAADDDIPF